MPMLKEFDFIQQLKKFQNLNRDIQVGIGDDTAVLSYDKRHYQLFTTDMLIENVHFTSEDSLVPVGYKAMACNISDIVAMGGWPQTAVVSLGLPKGMTLQKAKMLYQGLYHCAKKFQVSIVGGDTVRSKQITINVALLGQVEKKNLILRSGAKVGDQIFVTGLLGGSLVSKRHLHFTPRLQQARFLVQYFKPTSMIDISDGLLGDIRHILKASQVGARLYEKDIPCHRGVTLKQACCEGEDFELLFTIPSRLAKKLIECGQSHKMKFYCMGTITANRGKLQICKHNGIVQDITGEGYQHF